MLGGGTKKASSRVQVFGEFVDEGYGIPVAGAIDGVDSVSDKKPFAQLEVVGGEDEEKFEEFGALDYAVDVVCVWG